MKTLIVTMTQVNHTLRKAVSKQFTGNESGIGQQKIVDASACDVGALVLSSRREFNAVVLAMPAHRSANRSWREFLEAFKISRQTETPANFDPTFDSTINFLLMRGHHPQDVGKLITAVGLIYSDLKEDDRVEFVRVGRHELCCITHPQFESVS